MKSATPSRLLRWWNVEKQEKGCPDAAAWRTSLGGVGSGGFVRSPLACPIGPFRRVVALRLRRWTWACSRSWDWATAAGSSSAFSCAPLLLSPSATARPSCPSPQQKSCCRWACGKERGGALGNAGEIRSGRAPSSGSQVNYRML